MSTVDLNFIHEFVAAPDAGGQPASPVPTLLLLHGTSGDEHDLLPVGRALGGRAANLLSPRGQVDEGGALRFFRRLAPGVFDEEDVRRRADDLADFVAAAAGRYRFAADRVFAVGYSNGANVAAAILLRRPETFAGAVLFRSTVPLSAPALPSLGGGGARPPTGVLVLAGRSDPIIPPAESQQLADLLRRAGADVEVVLQSAGHELSPADFGAAQRWLAPRLRGA